MKTSFVAFSCAAVVVSIVAVSPSANAAPRDLEERETTETTTVEPRRPLRSLALEWNPLSLVLGRVSFNVEWAPARHHALILSPHFANPSADVATGINTISREAFTGAGGEIGYRYYTGRNGMNGLFLGPSLLFGFYNSNVGGESRAFSNIGWAFDLGLQALLFDRIVLGVGGGVEQLRVNRDFIDLPTRASSLTQPGFKPRILASVGVAF